MRACVFIGDVLHDFHTHTHRFVGTVCKERDIDDDNACVILLVTGYTSHLPRL